MNDEISVQELSEILEKDPNTVLIDVREKGEFDEINLSGKHIPFSEFEFRWREIPQDAPVCIHCYTGRRSRSALIRATCSTVNNREPPTVSSGSIRNSDANRLTVDALHPISRPASAGP